MNFKIQTASEMKNSNLARTLAHETHKNRTRVFTLGLALVSVISLGLFIPFAFSQDGVHAREGRFLKRIENNMYLGNYNLDGKWNVEKLFFGDFNAWLEFFYDPSQEGASGFRIVKKGASYILEVKYISNYEEASEEATEKHPPIGVSDPTSITDVIRNQIMEHNRNAFAKQYEEMVKLYKVETRSYSISNQFAEKLYQKMFFCIDNFEAKKVYPPDLVPVTRGGYTVTFRTVVDDAMLWSLMILNPHGNDVHKMADLCRQIISDAQANQLDEQKYITILETFEKEES